VFCDKAQLSAVVVYLEHSMWRLSHLDFDVSLLLFSGTHLSNILL